MAHTLPPLQGCSIKIDPSHGLRPGLYSLAASRLLETSQNQGFPSRPVRAVKTAILYRFGNVFRLEARGVFEVGDGAGYFQDAVVGAGAEALLGHGAFEQAFAVSGEFAVDADVAGVHLRVAVKLLAG